MHKQAPADRKEAALYWAAVSLLVCEGLPLVEVAERLDTDPDTLRSILRRRDNACFTDDSDLCQ